MAQNNWSLARDLHSIQYFHGQSLAETAGLVADWSNLHKTDDPDSDVIVTDVNFNLDGEFGWTATVIYCGDKLADV